MGIRYPPAALLGIGSIRTVQRSSSRSQLLAGLRIDKITIVSIRDQKRNASSAHRRRRGVLLTAGCSILAATCGLGMYGPGMLYG